MALTPEEIAELSQILDARSGRGRSSRPLLRLVLPPTPKLLDTIARDAHLRRIQHLKRAYRLEWLVDQETFDVASASCLEDCDLIRLLNQMERARECISEGISFEDAGLVRSLRVADHGYIKDTNAERSADRAAVAASSMRRQESAPADPESPPF